MKPIISAVVVTHNSENVIFKCLDALSLQSGCSLKIVVVDSGSRDSAYLDVIEKKYHCTVLKTSNVGFSQANNLGVAEVSGDCEMVVFVNPDAFLPPGYLENAFGLLMKEKEVAVISGVIQGYDVDGDKPSRHIDSTGIFRKWYGRWYDRDHGRDIAKIRRSRQYLPAVCGALFACRKEALNEFGEHVFDPDFFLYKEDIELSLRIRKHGWKLLFDPSLVAYHGRGWNQNRNEIPWSLKMLASKSEILLYRKHPSPYMIWALFKYVLVKYLKV